MLKAGFKENGQRQLVPFRRDMRVLRVAECAGCVVHRPDYVSCEGQSGIVSRGLVGESRHVVVPFCPVYCLCGQQVWIGTLPTTRNGCPMEIDEQTVTSSTFEQVETIVHIHLVVAREEIDLHPGNANPLTPCEFLLTVFGFVQPKLGRRSAVDPSHGRIVPDQRADTFLLRISDGVLDGLPILHFVPFGIYQNVWKSECCGHVYILFDDAKVVGTMVVGPVYPRHDAGLNPVRIGQAAGIGDIGDQRRFNNVSQRSHDDDAPRGVPTTVQCNLILVRTDFVELQLFVVSQARRTLPTFNICLGDEDETPIIGFQQRRIAPTAVVPFV